MLSSELEFCLNEAFQRARDQRHEFMTVEHLLLALLDIPRVHEILKACNSNITELRRQLTEFIEEQTPLLPQDDETDVQPTLGFQRVLQRAVFHVQSSGQKGSHRQQRAGCHFQRKAVPGRLLPESAGHYAARCHQFHFARHATGAWRRWVRGAGGVARFRIGAGSVSARSLCRQPESTCHRRQDRSPDRTRDRDRAYGADSLPADGRTTRSMWAMQVSAKQRWPKVLRG